MRRLRSPLLCPAAMDSPHPLQASALRAHKATVSSPAVHQFPQVMKVQCTFRRQNRVLHLLAARICRLRQIPHPQCNLVSFAALGVGNPRQEIPDARCDGWIDDRRPHHLRPFLCRRGTKRFRTLSRPVLSASFAPGVALHGRAQRRVGGTKRPVITPPPLAIEIRSCGARARNRSPPLHLIRMSPRMPDNSSA